jgi:translation initiation factor 1A
VERREKMAEKHDSADTYWDVEEWKTMTGTVCERKGKGDKNSKRRRSEAAVMRREVAFKTDGQVYGQVVAILCEHRCYSRCSDHGKTRLCKISGRLRHEGVRLSVGDVVLVGLRHPWITCDSKADVIYKYNHDEAILLKACDQLPPEFIKVGVNTEGKKPLTMNILMEKTPLPMNILMKMNRLVVHVD